MPFQKGNKLRAGKVSNPHGRKSIAVEFAAAKWLSECFSKATDVNELEALLAKKKYSAADVAKLKMLKGNDRLLNTSLNKLVPDLHDVTSGGKSLSFISAPEIDERLKKLQGK